MTFPQPFYRWHPHSHPWYGLEAGIDPPRLVHAYVERLRHYFSTDKLVPGEEINISIEEVYGSEHALKAVEASLADYDEEYGR